MINQQDIIDVAIPIPVEGPFTYRVPESLLDRVEWGRRVLVPFRNKLRAGFIVGIGSPETERADLREVFDIPEEDPYLTPSLWSFLHWVANYYILTTGLVLRTALPPGSKRSSKPWAILTPEGRRRFGSKDREGSFNLPPKILRTGVMALAELRDSIGPDSLGEAIDQDWVRVEERIARPRTLLWKKRLPGLLDPVGTRLLQLDTPPDLTSYQKAAVERLRDAAR